MNWYKIFYLFSIADKIGTVFGWLTIIFGIWLFINLILLIPSDDSKDKWKPEDWKIWRKSFYSSLFPFLIAIILWTFIPNKKQMVIIIAGGAVGEYILNDENAKEIPSDIFRLLRKEILEATDDIDNLEVKALVGDKIKTEKEKLMEKSKEELVKMLEESKEEATGQ